MVKCDCRYSHPKRGAGAAPGHKNKDTKDDEEGDQDSDSQRSSSSSGAIAPAQTNKVVSLAPNETVRIEARTNESVRGELKGQAITSKRWPEDLHTLIECVNLERAGFGDIPLKEQIAALNRLMEQLDLRLHQLEQLKERSSLSYGVKRLMGKLMELSAHSFSLRQEEAHQLQLSEAEQETRRQRHLARYGRSYRTGLQTHITRMQADMALLQSKQAEFSRYSKLMVTIEAKLAQAPKIETHPPAKHTTTQESLLKVSLKAQMLREVIAETAPPALHNDSQKSSIETYNIEIKNNIKNNDINTQAKPPHKTNPMGAKQPALPLNLVSNIVVERPVGQAQAPLVSDPATRAERAVVDPAIVKPVESRLAIPPRVPFSRLEPALLDQVKPEAAAVKAIGRKAAEIEALLSRVKVQAAPPEVPPSLSRQAWFKKGEVKGNPLMERIAQEAKTHRAVGTAEERLQRSEVINPTLKTSFNLRSTEPAPVKRMLNAVRVAQTKQEAALQRQTIDPSIRAKPYPPSVETPTPGADQLAQLQSKLESIKNVLSNRWRVVVLKQPHSQNKTVSQTKPKRVKMSNTFNHQSAQETTKPQPNPTNAYDHDPD